MAEASHTPQSSSIDKSPGRGSSPNARQEKRSPSWEDVVEGAQGRAASGGLTAKANLVRLADQLHALASELEGSSEVRAAVPLTHADDPAQPISSREAVTGDSTTAGERDQRSSFLAIARARYESRRNRIAVFNKQELFGEPGWDILLDLYIAFAEGKSVSVSSACIGSASPPTTGLRWLGVLQGAGLVERKHDEQDQRRVLVHLSEKGVQQMEAYFERTLALNGAASLLASH